MDTKSLALSINNLAKCILVCYKRLCILDMQGKSSSLEYEKILKVVNSLTKLEDYFYDFIFSNGLKDKVIDELFEIYNVSELKYIATGEWCLLFNDLSDETLCGFRVLNHINNIYSKKVLGDTGCTNDVVNSYVHSVEKRKQIFLDSVRELCESGECGKHKKEMYSSLYNFAFIYKKDDNVEKTNYPTIVGNGKDIETVTNLSRKMIRLNEKSVNVSSNFRKILLNMCYIRSMFVMLPEYISHNIIDEIGHDTNKDSYGYKILLSIFDESKELRSKYNDDDFNLKRKI